MTGCHRNMIKERDEVCEDLRKDKMELDRSVALLKHDCKEVSLVNVHGRVLQCLVLLLCVCVCDPLYFISIHSEPFNMRYLMIEVQNQPMFQLLSRGLIPDLANRSLFSNQDLTLLPVRIFHLCLEPGLVLLSLWIFSAEM